ncbi:Uma2 family endonuclease [Planotetraspora sp. A-T 1434]|uniref:Uma2 family endonuclease n=1 Tax=Planotetraspora sp. A-T 1434 TaxID=2979219 RepID=UPI0021BE369C|nr:Uma2 family endonuclease [Planotetraspora sp. A-T 1434]MCT9928797.1 Uma2 family endonuclease [Planotetraspora sp. A-T 1434]
MVATSRKPHATLQPVPDRPLPSTPRELFDSLPPLPGLRTEIIDGRLIVSPVGTPEHGLLAMRLFRSFIPLMDERGWDAWAGNVDVCVDGPRDPVGPDFVLAPKDCPRWGERELLSSGLKLVAEVVSRGSAEDDRGKKPGIYAGGGVPVMLLIDPIATPPAVTVFSEPKDGRYHTSASVTFGREIHIPDPVDFTLDTSVFEEVL